MTWSYTSATAFSSIFQSLRFSPSFYTVRGLAFDKSCIFSGVHKLKFILDHPVVNFYDTFCLIFSWHTYGNDRAYGTSCRLSVCRLFVRRRP